MRKLFFSFITILFILLFTEGVQANASDKSEIRAVYFGQLDNWWSPGYNWTIMAATLKAYKIDVCVIPASTAWGYDQKFLSDAITACHNLNLTVHISFNVLGGAPMDPKYDVVDYRNIIAPWYDPCKNATRELIKSIVTDLASNYSIDGFSFDYIRYAEGDSIDNDQGQSVPEDGVSYSDECKAMFAQWLSEQGRPMNSSEWPSAFIPGGARHNEFMEWRVIPVTNLVRDIREWMKAYKPNLEFWASVWELTYSGYPDRWRWAIGQDTGDWVAKGYLDFVSPMTYQADLNTFESHVDLANQYFVGGPNGLIPMATFITTGCFDSGINGNITPDTFRDEILYLRQQADGFGIWRYGGPGAGPNNCTTSNSGPGYVGGTCLINITTYLNKVNETNPNGWFDTFSLQNISVENITNTTATVQWTTDLPTNSKVEYNSSPLFVATKKIGGYRNFAYWDIDHVPGYIKSDSTNVTSHSITLTGLQGGMVYYYRAQSQDNFGMVTSKIYNFSAGDIIYPVNITGTISYYDNGSPTPDATITCGSFSTTTNATGGYLLNMLSYAPGSCNVTAAKEGYVTKTTSFSFTENKTYEIDFVLDKIKYIIGGTLTNSTNNPVHATITAYQPPFSTVAGSNQTDANGNYVLTLLPGVYDIEYNLTNFYIPNYYIRIPSVDITNSNYYDMVKSVTGNSKENNVSIIFNIDEAKMIEIYGQLAPTTVSQNGTVIKNVSSLSELKNNSWFYEGSTTKRLSLITTPWSAPVCGNKVCESGEKETSDLYYCSSDCPIGMLGYWKFDEGTGNIAYDSSGFGNNGTLMNNPTWVTNCVHGKCLSFDGVDDYVAIKKFGDYSEGFSIEFWFNMKQSSSYQRPFTSFYFSTCYVSPGSTTFVCFLGDGGDWSGSLYSNGWSYNSWNHFAMTYNVSTGTWIIYRNGTSVATGSYNKVMAMTKDLAISSLYWETGYQDPFYGTIDEVAIYNRALTQQEVYQHYLNGIS